MSLFFSSLGKEMEAVSLSSKQGERPRYSQFNDLPVAKVDLRIPCHLQHPVQRRGAGDCNVPCRYISKASAMYQVSGYELSLPLVSICAEPLNKMQYCLPARSFMLSSHAMAWQETWIIRPQIRPKRDIPRAAIGYRYGVAETDSHILAFRQSPFTKVELPRCGSATWRQWLLRVLLQSS